MVAAQTPRVADRRMILVGLISSTATLAVGDRDVDAGGAAEGVEQLDRLVDGACFFQHATQAQGVGDALGVKVLLADLDVEDFQHAKTQARFVHPRDHPDRPGKPTAAKANLSLPR